METRRIIACALLTGLICVLTFAGCVTSPPGPSGDASPATTASPASLTFRAPKTDAHRSYLGIGTAPSFSLGDVQAEYLLIEVFDYYCPYCQKEAPHVNRLYDMIQERPDLRNRLKMLGIGWGNSPLEVELFQRKYGIPFPLFPDKEERVLSVIELKGTPNFTLLKKETDGRLTLLYNESEHLDDVPAFFEKMVARAGLR